ncbi:hypothetical protein JKP88DRAFT_219744 [Tribonema minus]|uniref:Uncharacterized protein n=1 Tax=Tribonema minus TaxID=303371 RepID=A0A836CFV1_9STRA|nr:hypothetical protein JKP88DRAFT_219744 [Tribonema minus]
MARLRRAAVGNLHLCLLLARSGRTAIARPLPPPPLACHCCVSALCLHAIPPLMYASALGRRVPSHPAPLAAPAARARRARVQRTHAAAAPPYSLIGRGAPLRG